MVNRRDGLGDASAIQHSHLRLAMEVESALASVNPVDAVMVLAPVRPPVVPRHPQPVAVVVGQAHMGLEVLACRDALQGSRSAADEPAQEDVVVSVPVAVPCNGRLAARVDRDRGFPIVGRMLGDLDWRRPRVPLADHQGNVGVCLRAGLVGKVHIPVRRGCHPRKRIRTGTASQAVSCRRSAQGIFHLVEMHDAVADPGCNSGHGPGPARTQGHLVVFTRPSEGHRLVPLSTVGGGSKPNRVRPVFEGDPCHPQATVRADGDGRIVVVGQAFRHAFRARHALDTDSSVEEMQGLGIADLIRAKRGIALGCLDRNTGCIAAVYVHDNALPTRRSERRLVLRLHLELAVPLVAATPGGRIKYFARTEMMGRHDRCRA